MSKRIKKTVTLENLAAELGVTVATIETIAAPTGIVTAAGQELDALIAEEPADMPNLVTAEITELLEDLETAPVGSVEPQAPAEEPSGAQEQSEELPAAGDPSQSLADLMDDVSDAEADEASVYTVADIDDRIAYEAQKNPDNSSIAASLNKSRSKLAIRSASRFLIATQVDTGFVNRSISTGSAYNVYAIDKVADLVAGLSGGTMKNQINIAICRSLFKFRAAGVVFTGEMARAAASDKVRVEAAMRKLLVSHTVSASTAPTQASSTMSALQTLGIVTNKGSQKNPVYELTDTPQTRALEVLAA